jgi:hypothetical protein
VAFDPLDGSSIFSANFAVGTIFGVWPGASPLGQTGRQQAAAAYSVYGPRTLLVLALPTRNGSSSGSQQQQQCPDDSHQQQQPCSNQQQPQQQPSQVFEVLEFAHSEGHGWRLRQVHARLGNNNNVAPANIKAAKDNAAYEALMLRWIANGCKLRYSGGMVPDIHHILAKVGLAGWAWGLWTGHTGCWVCVEGVCVQGGPSNRTSFQLTLRRAIDGS